MKPEPLKDKRVKIKAVELWQTPADYFNYKDVNSAVEWLKNELFLVGLNNNGLVSHKQYSEKFDEAFQDLKEE